MTGSVLSRPLELVERNFERPAGTSGQLVGHLMTVQHRTLSVWTAEHMDIRRSHRVLDIGCGGGMAVKLLSERASRGFVAGVDYSMDMVRQAVRRNIEGVARGLVEIQHADVSRLPYESGQFDRVSAIETFYFWPDPMRGLAEAHRVLKPGGQVAVTLEMSREAAESPSPIQRYFGRRFTRRSEQAGLHILSGRELTDMLAKAGFTDTRFVSEPRRSLGWVCAMGRK